MSRALVSSTLALTFGLSLVTGAPVAADTPDPPNATVPCQINLVGTTGGVADPNGEFSVIVRDPASNPVEGAEVRIDFNLCPDLRVSTVQPFPGVTVDCSGPVGSVSAFTDEHGMATFRIVGAARNLTGGDPGAGFQCARIYADGVLFAYVNIGAYDEDGSGGVNPADLSVWMVDFFEGVYLGRSDFNCSQHINPADLALLLNAALHEGSRTSPQSYCH